MKHMCQIQGMRAKYVPQSQYYNCLIIKSNVLSLLYSIVNKNK